MAAPALQMSAPALSQKQRKVVLRKERRKRKRQALAQARECGLNNGEICTSEDDELNGQDDVGNDTYELEKIRLHEEWLERERLAQEEFRLRCEREEAAQKRKEEEERMIKEEWEAQQKKEQEEKEQKQKEKRDREKQPSNSLTKDTNRKKSSSSQNKDEAVQKMLDEAENQLENKGPWMNPEAPVIENSENYGTECDIANCPFFLKTGACRFGDRCSRKHDYPTASPTLMIRGMFTTFGMDETRRDDYDVDAWLEHSEEDILDSFLEFYHDVLPEMKSVGKVVQFKVCCNYEPHLRGNVYVQFDTEEQCKEAFIKFNGRWYAGRQLHCELSPVTRWKNAICGLFDRQKCPKGKHCNFLHVFRNPKNEFWEADRDLHLSPDRSARGSHRGGRYSEKYLDRSWRQRHRSRSPLRSERSDSRRDSDRRRSRSQERRTHVKRSSRSGHTDRRNDRCRSRSRDRSRSRSRRDRDSDRLRNGSREKDKYRNRSKGRDSLDRDSDTRGKVREKSRSSSRERKRSKRSRERSPKTHDKNEETPNGTKVRRHHKKSKKTKSKKKHKKKSHRSEEMSSSGESDTDKETKDATMENLSASSCGQVIPETQPVQKDTELEGNHCDDCEKSFNPDVKSEHSDTEMERQLIENDEISTS